LDLTVLRVNDSTNDEIQYASYAFFIITFITSNSTVLQGSLGHVHGILVVRDHFAHEQDHVIVKSGPHIVSSIAGGHAIQHEAVHGINARRVSPERGA